MECDYLGLEIGGTKLQIVAGNGAGEISVRHRLTVDPKFGAAGIRRQIETTLPRMLAGFRPRAAGVGFGGPVDWRRGVICKSHQIEGWSEFDLGGWLSGLIGAPVSVDNDANTAALGEALTGAGVGANPVFYVTLGSGVGGGLALDGKIYHGRNPGESEVGHIRLDRAGTIVESRCSGWAVDARIRALKSADSASVLCKLSAGEKAGEARHLAAALAVGDSEAARIVNEVAEDLAFGLSHVTHLFHPEVIILGGGLAGVGEPLRSAVSAALARFVMDAFAPGPRIALSALRDDAVPVGALRLAAARICL